MMNDKYLQFNVISKPDKDLYKLVQSNAKFKTLSDVVRTKVGINNFYNFSIGIHSTIVMRDIILNSQFVSGWARSSQVLNNTDSKYAGYRFLTKSDEQTESWIKMMEELQSKGHSQDNMRSLITLDSINDYAISIDLLHLIYLDLVLDSIRQNSLDTNLKNEATWFLTQINGLLSEYDIDCAVFQNMLVDAMRDFPVIDATKKIDIADVSCEDVFEVSATYSVVGQIWRHRTMLKQYDAHSYSELVDKIRQETAAYDYSKIDMHEEIAEIVKKMTDDARSIYSICQGSIVPFKFTGTVGAVYKALCQRTCFINDSPQFKDAFDLFKQKHPDMKLLPPCRLNTSSSNSCYVGYVNESRLRGEELTQKICPIYAKSKGYTEAYKDTLNSNKTKWYLENLDMWKNVCK